MQGVYPFFDYGFVNDATCPAVPNKKNNYPENSIMDILERKHPKMAFIAKTARLDVQLGEMEMRATLFLPPEDRLSENMVKGLDINSARRFLKYHLLIGIFPKNVITTSPYQNLQTSIKGQMITARLEHVCVLNDHSVIMEWDEIASNGVIHHISEPLLP